MNFTDLFRQATGFDSPYPYQVDFAQAELLPNLLNVPTGAGKTATAILGWLYRRRFHPSPPVRLATPRRLVYCLPMRTLCEQTVAAAQRWLTALGLQAASSDDGLPADHQPTNPDRNPAPIRLSVLMGGEDAGDWALFPEHESIIVGTQDMLLSRALNRGYGSGRFYWPIEFAALNNDCLWIFDEPQLMANGVATSAQLTGLREKLGTLGPCTSVWMSATLEPHWLSTFDLPHGAALPALKLSLGDLEIGRPLHRRMTASKRLAAAPSGLGRDPKALAKYVLQQHTAQSQTLVIVNTVGRAKALYKALTDLLAKARSGSPRMLLLHSRFRPQDRRHLNAALQDPASAADRVIIATQVVEAGVDLSARTLITELAPWASLVQRIGRCNRAGEYASADVKWVDLADKQYPPYEADNLEQSRRLLSKLEGADVSPESLERFKDAEGLRLDFEHTHLLRRRDLLDLYDTTPDLTGNDTDVQRFVRSDDKETDAQVFWRAITAPQDQPAPLRDELCSVPIVELRKFLADHRDKWGGYVWDHIDSDWTLVRDPARQIIPGQNVMLPQQAGGYSALGWDPESKTSVLPLAMAQQLPPEGAGSDPLSSTALPLTILEHTRHVLDELRTILNGIQVPSPWADWLQAGAIWHDVGKAHAAFQTGVRTANPDLPHDELWAKSGRRGILRHGRPYFRHELVSALAALQHAAPFGIAYLVAAHHGRIRLSIRPAPDEAAPVSNQDLLFALGVHDGDRLRDVELPGYQTREVALDLKPMQFGSSASWTARALGLLAEVGPFRLAQLEAILRAADVRASQKEAK